MNNDGILLIITEEDLNKQTPEINEATQRIDLSGAL